MRVSAAFSLGTLVMAAILPAMTQARADSVETLSQVCVTCHGQAGVPVDPAIPVIWGQNEGYLYLQLRDMKRGARKVDAMKPIVGDFGTIADARAGGLFRGEALAQPGAARCVRCRHARAHCRRTPRSAAPGAILPGTWRPVPCHGSLGSSVPI